MLSMDSEPIAARVSTLRRPQRVLLEWLGGGEELVSCLHRRGRKSGRRELRLRPGKEGARVALLRIGF
jgi:hypothetical protein